MTQGSHAAEIKVFATGASRSAYQTLAPQFERDTGHKLVTEFDLPPALVRKIDAGEPYDVIILSYDVEALIKQGKVAADSRTAFGKIGVGIAVHRGSPKPDFSTVEAFKRSMLDAKLIATSGEGSSGRYVASLIERLGIAERLAKSDPRNAVWQRELTVSYLRIGDVHLAQRQLDNALASYQAGLGWPNAWR